MASNQHILEDQMKQNNSILKVKADCTKRYERVWTQTSNLSDLYYDPKTKELMCPPYFDVACWPPQRPNTTAKIQCPTYLAGLSPNQNATRTCMENGQWFTINGKTYSNFSECYNSSYVTIYKNYSKPPSYTDANTNYVHMLEVLSETGYAVSLVTLLVAFTIMLCIKKLHCARNILHMNLFASFILRAAMHLLKDSLFENGLGLGIDLLRHNGSVYFHVDSRKNNFECKLIVSLLQYFMAANYSWILMEGLYLNNLILRALFTDSNKNLIYYIIFGWGLPVFVVVPWVIARILVEDEYCWTQHENIKIYAILAVPTFASILINFVLFVIISIVLYNKLKSPVNENSQRYLKWAKSTLVLVPLFGVNYALCLIFYVVNEKHLWLIFDLLFGSFQGFFVAILYCFLNGEVKSEVKPYITTFLISLATNDCTKYCFPRREKYLSSVVGRHSVCTTMSCSSLYSVNHNRHNKTRNDHLAKIKLTNLHSDNTKEFYLPNVPLRHSIPKNGHYVPNLTFVHKRNSMNATTDVDLYDVRQQNYSQNLPTCEEEVAMLEDLNVQHLPDDKSRHKSIT